MNKVFKIVIWGLGTNGKNLIDVLDKNNIAAIIDCDENKVKEKTYFNIPIINFEEYKANYNDYFIVVSPMKYVEIENLLKGEEIQKYFIMNKSSIRLIVFLNLKNNTFHKDFKLKKDILYLINGVNLFSVCLHKYLIRYGYQVEFIALTQEQYYELDLLVDENIIEGYCHREVVKGEKVCLIETEKSCECNNVNVISCDMINERFYLKWETDLKKFKNRHLGERVFIVATGPSIRVEDLEKLEKYSEISISMNCIYHIFEKTRWRPDYYIISDGLGIREYEKIVKREELFEGIEKIFSDNYLKFWTLDLDDSYHGFRQEQNMDDIRFSEDFSKVVYSGMTVVYTCLQWAAYLGFKEIFLLGCDFSFSKNFDSPTDHFYNKIKSNYTFDYEYVKKGYEKAYEYAKSHDIKIFNATHGGKLEVFQRVDFDKLF